jgi:hypothetical protein
MSNINLPRRCRRDRCVPAENAIQDAMYQVELIGADERLTEAIVKLTEAKNLVGDVIDEQLKNSEEVFVFPDDLDKIVPQDQKPKEGFLF